MRRMVLVLAVLALVIGCTPQQRARRLGGSARLDLKPCEKLEMATWKEDDLFVAGNGWLAHVRIHGRAILEHYAGEGPFFMSVSGNFGWGGSGKDWTVAQTEFFDLASTAAVMHAERAASFDDFAATVGAGYAGPHSVTDRLWEKSSGSDFESVVEVTRILDVSTLTPNYNTEQDLRLLGDPPPGWDVDDMPRGDP